jgi:hypothetical protein
MDFAQAGDGDGECYPASTPETAPPRAAGIAR